MTTVQALRPDELAPAAAVLARAFRDDPVSTFLWPDAATREARATRSFDAQLRVLRDRREVLADHELSAVAVWARPDEWRVPTALALRLVGPTLRSRVRLRSLLAYAKTDALHPEEPHWYLEYLGTEPQRQRAGLGSRVLAAGLARADADGLPVWAWSSNRANLGFYHRHGFAVLEEVTLGAGGPTIFPIRRDPR